MLRETPSKFKPRSSWFKKTAVLAVVAGVFFVVQKVSAQPNLGINSLAEGGLILGQTDIRVIIGRIVQIFLGLLGMIAVIIILYAGFLWMTAGGDSGKIAIAKKWMINGVIGLVIILSAFSIAQFIVGSLIEATTGGAGGAGTGVYSQPLSGSLGSGIIQSHIPERNGTAYRNTKIAITFKEAISEKNLITDTNGDGIYGNTSIGDRANTKVFKVAKTATLKANGNNFSKLSDSDLVATSVAYTIDKKIFVFKPTAYLGNATEAVSYTVYLTSDLLKNDGNKAFSGAFSSGYQWEFQVDPKVDNTPPKLVNVIPSKGSTARNTLVQMNFDESLDPTSAAGDATTSGGFQNILMKNSGSLIVGSYKISNSYKTVEFVTTDLCGTNSCGGSVYCLPASATITGLVRAAQIGTDAPQASGFPYNGIVDLAGNSFDGNGDGKAVGPQSQSGKAAHAWVGGNATTQGDDVTWQFITTDKIDLTPPKLSKVYPSLSAENVGIDTNIQMTFNKVMSASSLNNSNLAVTHDVPSPYELWYSVNTESLDSNDQVTATGVEPTKTRAVVKHGSFAPSVSGGTQYNFYPSANSDIQDLYQNCYNPATGPSCTPTATLPYCCNGTAQAKKCSYLP